MLEPFDSPPRRHRAKPKRTRGINTHQRRSIERTILHGIPVTTPIQTLIHLSAVLPFKTLRRAVNEALNRRLITPERPRHHPPPRREEAPRSVLATAAPTRSENENLVLHLLHDAGIAKPLVNPRIPRTNKIPDFLWPDRDLILEADSRRYHDHLLARADDARQAAESSKPSATRSSAPPGPR